MINQLEISWRRFRNSFSRTALALRYLKRQKPVSKRDQPGLIMIQIDGLARPEIQKALAAGRMPFLAKLLREEHYENHAMYSGITSNTPSVQGELFYGVRHAVPSFNYFDSDCGRIMSMFEGADAREIQSRMEARGDGLLKEGSAYANIYDGGAKEFHFCMRQLGWPNILQNGSKKRMTLLAFLHLPSVLRTLGLLVIEFGLAVVDTFRGLIKKENFWREVKFIPARMAVSIGMREAIVIRSAMDLMRGFPIVQMNFLGYDEQAHRRGPDAAFAHWTLKGIDDAIRRVYRAAGRSLHREYDLWIYSDHGQGKVLAYEDENEETLQAAVARITRREFETFEEKPELVFPFSCDALLKTERHRKETQPPEAPPLATALGPFGCIYTFAEMTDAQRDQLGTALSTDAKIPMLVAKDRDESARVWTPNGNYLLPQDADIVLGMSHPFKNQVVRDLIELSCHPHSGDFLVCGYCPNGKSLSFAVENGAHGGVSPHETSAFVIAPSDAPIPDSAWRRGFLEISDLRKAALIATGRLPVPQVASPVLAPAAPVHTLKIMSYNIHNGVGMDGALSPHRIARVIEREKPDIVALQEVDVNRRRSGSLDQAHLLAHYLSMYHEFHPALQIEEEKYGEAILSRFPMRVMKADALPYRRSLLVDEHRGALWVQVDIGGGYWVNLINTHLGLGFLERKNQMAAIASDEWLQHPDCKGPLILCGDLNVPACSSSYRHANRILYDVQKQLPGHKANSTFSSRFPFLRLDHIFVDDAFKVEQVRVPGTDLVKVASDHRPLVATLRLRNPV